jgi:hypothetical protein
VTTDYDRQAAEELRVTLANLTGFWHKPGDDGPICQALSRFREECERRLLDKLLPWTGGDSSSPDQATVTFENRPAPKPVSRPAFTELKRHAV